MKKSVAGFDPEYDPAAFTFHPYLKSVYILHFPPCVDVHVL